MKTDGDRFDHLLKSWPAIDPSPAFEANVRRRLRQSAADQPAPTGWWYLLPALTDFRQAYLSAAAALIGIAAGLTGALTQSTPESPLQQNLFKPLPERSLSASYVHLVGGKKL